MRGLASRSDFAEGGVGEIYGVGSTTAQFETEKHFLSAWTGTQGIFNKRASPHRMKSCLCESVIDAVVVCV